MSVRLLSLQFLRRKTMDIQSELEKMKDGLLQQRDELRVQMGLAKLEAKDEWEKAEAKLEQFAAKLEDIGNEAKEASEDVFESVKSLGEEVKNAFERISKRF
jgi:uncharacterized protein (DUF342 family)